MLRPGPAADCTPSAQPRLGPGMWQLFVWLLWGDFVLVLMEQVMPSLFPLMLRDHQASNQGIGFIMGTLPTLIGLVLGPLLSYRSDRCRSRLGRRRPFMIFSIPLTVLALIAFPFAPEITACLLGFSWLQALFAAVPAAPLIFILAVLYALYKVFDVVCSSAYNWLFVDVVPQSHMGRFMSLLRMATLFGSFAFNYFLMGLAETHLKEIFLGVGAIYAVGFGLVCWKVREQPLPPPAEEAVRQPFLEATREFFVTCFRNPYYLWIYGASLLYGWSALAGSLFAVLFMRETLHMDLDTLGKVRAWVTILVIPVSYMFGSLIDRWRSQKVIVYAVLLYALGNLACFLFIRGTLSFMIWTFITNITAYFFGVTYAAYVANALPKEKYAQLTTAMGLVTSFFGVTLMSPICGKVFDLLDNNYRYVYLWQAVFLVFCALIFWHLKGIWIRYGGPDHFKAP
jgi:maltose/moltooligosaccharide transporter